MHMMFHNVKKEKSVILEIKKALQIQPSEFQQQQLEQEEQQQQNNKLFIWKICFKSITFYPML